MSQEQKIMEFLKKNTCITQRDAFRMGIYRLGARIWDLRNNGVPINSEYVRVENADGTHTYIAQYSMAKEADK